MENLIEIKLNEGLGVLQFGMTYEQVTAIIGEPDDTDEVETDDSTNAKVYSYWDEAIVLFFEGKKQQLLTNIEVDNLDATLFGEKVFDFEEKDVIDLMKKHGFQEIEEEEEEWGEKRITFDEAMLDFYFEDGVLNSVSWGVAIDENDNIIKE